MDASIGEGSRHRPSIADGDEDEMGRKQVKNVCPIEEVSVPGVEQHSVELFKYVDLGRHHPDSGVEDVEDR